MADRGINNQFASILNHQRLISIALVAFLLRFLVVGALRGAVTPGGLRNVDFDQYWLAGQRLEKREKLYFVDYADLYAGHPYVYPPLLAFIFEPLTHVAEERVENLLTICSIALLVIAIGLVFWSLAPPASFGAVVFMFMLITAFRYWPTIVELSLNNVDMILLTLICGMYICDRRENWILLGTLIGAGALVKTWLFLLVIYLIMRHRWWGVVAAMAVCLAGLAGSFAMLGWNEFTEFVEIQRIFAHQPRLLVHSVPGVASLFFRANRHIVPVSQNEPLFFLFLVSGLVVIGLGIIKMYRTISFHSAQVSQQPLSFVIMSVLLILPICHVNYYVFALPAFWSCCLQMPSRRSWSEWSAIALALAFYLILASPSPSVIPVPDADKVFPRSLLVITPFLAGAILWVALLIRLSGSERQIVTR